MFPILRLIFGTITRLFCSRGSLLMENLVLRQQLAVFKRRHPRPRLDLSDRMFWIAVRRFWSDWKKFPVVVLPEAVVRWHQAGFELYWHHISSRFRGRYGRKRIPKEVRELIFRMVSENPTWGAGQFGGVVDSLPRLGA